MKFNSKQFPISWILLIVVEIFLTIFRLNHKQTYIFISWKLNFWNSGNNSKERVTLTGFEVLREGGGSGNDEGENTNTGSNSKDKFEGNLYNYDIQCFLRMCSNINENKTGRKRKLKSHTNIIWEFLGIQLQIVKYLDNFKKIAFLISRLLYFIWQKPIYFLKAFYTNSITFFFFGPMRRCILNENHIGSTVKEILWYTDILLLLYKQIYLFAGRDSKTEQTTPNVKKRHR